MKKGTPTNMAASVRTRLLSYSKAKREDFTYVLTRYALERLLARLERSAYRETFTLKGAMLFRVWSPTLHRPTKDLDLLGSGAPDIGRLEGIFQELCEVSVDADPPHPLKRVGAAGVVIQGQSGLVARVVIGLEPVVPQHNRIQG